MNSRRHGKKKSYLFATRLLKKTGRKKGRGLGTFSSSARQILSAIARQDYEAMRYACILNSMNPLEALLLTCVKWVFNVPDKETMVAGDFCKWSLGRGTNTSPLCMCYITDGDMIDCEQCIVDAIGQVCWLPNSAYSRTVWHCKKGPYALMLLYAFKKAVKQYHYLLRKTGSKENALRKRVPLMRSLYLFQVQGEADEISKM